MRFTRKEKIMDENIYQGQIIQLLNLLFRMSCHGQTKPDGKNCTICGDNGHQAFECDQNAFKLRKMLGF